MIKLLLIPKQFRQDSRPDSPIVPTRSVKPIKEVLTKYVNVILTGRVIHVGGSYVVVEANRVEDCAEWGIYVASDAVRCVVSKNSVEGCSTTDTFTEAVGIYVLGDDCRVSDNYAVVVNDTILAGSYVVGLVLGAARCLATGNNINAVGAGGATLCGILFGNESVGSCVATGNHMNGKGFVDLVGGTTAM
jgi:hypothetical protein